MTTAVALRCRSWRADTARFDTLSVRASSVTLAGFAGSFVRRKVFDDQQKGAKNVSVGEMLLVFVVDADYLDSIGDERKRVHAILV